MNSDVYNESTFIKNIKEKYMSNISKYDNINRISNIKNNYIFYYRLVDSKIILPSLTGLLIEDIIKTGFIKGDLKHELNEKSISFIEQLAVHGIKNIENKKYGKSKKNMILNYAGEIVLYQDTDDDKFYIQYDNKETYEVDINKIISVSEQCLADYNAIVRDKRYYKNTMFKESTSDIVTEILISFERGDITEKEKEFLLYNLKY